MPEYVPAGTPTPPGHVVVGTHQLPREWAALYDEIKDTEWDSSEDWEDKVETARKALSLRASGVEKDEVIEKALRRGLKKLSAEISDDVRNARWTIRLVGPELRRQKELQLELEKAECMALASMATGQLHRVGAPHTSCGCQVEPILDSKGRPAAGYGLSAFRVRLSNNLGKDIALKGSTVWPAEVTQEDGTVVPRGVMAAEALTELYEALGKGLNWEPWVCTPEAAQSKEKDLLGMCPGGSLHLSAEVLKEKKQGRCNCGACCASQRKKRELKDISELEEKDRSARRSLKPLERGQRVVRQLLRRFNGEDEDEDEEGPEDPVFYAEDLLEEGEAEADEEVRRTWERVHSQLAPSDFPLRLVFLDKSGSMGFDYNTYEVLQLAVKNCMQPTSGSTLLFLFAAPGETEMILRRPGDPPIPFQLELGCATWFNEPIVRALRFLAPTFAAVNQPDAAGQTWAQRNNQPPVQVLCLTDGYDNCSPNRFRTLEKVVREVKRIEHSGEPLYLPVVGNTPMATQGKVPVWMCWVAVGVGGQQLVDSKVPADVAVVDAVVAPRFRSAVLAAVPQLRALQAPEEDRGDTGVSRSTTASRARSVAAAANVVGSGMSAESKWSEGYRIVVTTETGRKKHGVISKSHGDTVDVLFDDETSATVPAPEGAPKEAPSQLGQKRRTARGLGSREGTLQEQRTKVLSVAASLTQDLSLVMRSAQSTGEPVRLEDARTPADLDVEAQLKEAAAGVAVANAESQPVDLHALLLSTMYEAGRVAAPIGPDERPCAQRLVSAALELLVCGGSLEPGQIVPQLGSSCGVGELQAARRLPLAPNQVEGWQAQLARPAVDLLQMMQRRGFVETSRSGVMSAREECRGTLGMVWRFLNPQLAPPQALDALRRCVDRYQRLRPPFACMSAPRTPSTTASTPDRSRRRTAPRDSDPDSPPSSSEGRARKSGSVVNLQLGLNSMLAIRH